MVLLAPMDKRSCMKINQSVHAFDKGVTDQLLMACWKLHLKKV